MKTGKFNREKTCRFLIRAIVAIALVAAAAGKSGADTSTFVCSSASHGVCTYNWGDPVTCYVNAGESLVITENRSPSEPQCGATGLPGNYNYAVEVFDIASPSGLVMTTDGGALNSGDSASATLNWAASSGADTYQIEISVAGGGFTTATTDARCGTSSGRTNSRTVTCTNLWDATNYQFRVAAIDTNHCAGGSDQTSSYATTIVWSAPDRTLPVQSAWSPATGTTVTSTGPSIAVNLNEAGDCRWSLTDQAYGAMGGDCTGDGSTSQICATSGLTAGATNTVFISCRDLAGNADTAATNIQGAYNVDNAAPVKSGWSPASGTTIGASTQTVTFTTNEAANCKWSLADQAYGAMGGDCTGDGTTSQSCAVTGLSEGANIVHIACSDIPGNADTAATNADISYTVDTSMTIKSNFSPANGATIVTSTPTVTLSTNETADCRWSLTDLAYGAMAGDCTGDGTTSQSCAVSGLSEGANAIHIACRDSMGNADTAASNADVNYTLDTVAPQKTNISPANGANLTTTSPTVTLSTNENADCRWSLTVQAYGAMTGDCTGDGTTSQSCATSGLAQGANAVHIACRDSAGNADTAGTNADISYTVDTSLAQKTNFSPANGASLSTTSPTVTFTTNENADCRWSLTDLAYGAMTGDCTGDGTTSQSCVTSGLSQGANAIHIACRDSSGNTDTAATNADINYTVDTSLVQKTNFLPANGASISTPAPTVTFTTSENADCRWSPTDAAYGAMAGDCTGNGTTSQSCAITGLSEGANTVHIACSDSLGNTDTAATNADISYTLDTTPAQKTNISPANGSTISTTSPAVTLSTNENADCKWSLTDLAYGAMAGDCTGDGTTSQSCAVYGLSEGTGMVFIACRDAIGNSDTAATNADVSYTVDTSTTQKTNFLPANNAAVANSTPTVTFTTSENADCKWSLTDQPYEAMSGDCSGDGTTSQSCATTGLSAGINTLYFACRDAIGNADSAGSNEHLTLIVGVVGSYNTARRWQFLYVCPPVSADTIANLGPAKKYQNGQYVAVDLSQITSCTAIVASPNGTVSMRAVVPEGGITLPITPGWNMLYNPYDIALEYDGTHFEFIKDGETAAVPFDQNTYVSDYAVIGPGMGQTQNVPDDVPAIPAFSAFFIFSKAAGQMTIHK